MLAAARSVPGALNHLPSPAKKASQLYMQHHAMACKVKPGRASHVSHANPSTVKGGSPLGASSPPHHLPAADYTPNPTPPSPEGGSLLAQTNPINNISIDAHPSVAPESPALPTPDMASSPRAPTAPSLKPAVHMHAMPNHQPSNCWQCECRSGCSPSALPLSCIADAARHAGAVLPTAAHAAAAGSMAAPRPAAPGVAAVAAIFPGSRLPAG